VGRDGSGRLRGSGPGAEVHFIFNRHRAGNESDIRVLKSLRLRLFRSEIESISENIGQYNNPSHTSEPYKALASLLSLYGLRTALLIECSRQSNKMQLLSLCLAVALFHKVLSLCNTGCTACVTSPTCTACSGGYYLLGVSCAACSANCQSCPSNVLCTTCKGGYWKTVPNTCTQCQPSCAVCSSISVCSTCSPGYYLTPPSCTICVTNCALCSNGTSCTTCTVPYHKLSTPPNCGNCLANQYVDGLNTCQNCPPLCSLCSSTILCSACITGAYLNGASCVACGTYCAQCSNGTSCDVCRASFVGSSSVPRNCECAARQFNNSGVCANCGSHCAVCSSATACTTCDNGYYLSLGGCPQCGTNCSNCSNGSTCNLCQVGHAQTTPVSANCVTCLSHQFINASNQCQNCISNCVSCSLSQICITCSPSHFFTGTTCNPCGNYCQTCHDSSSCDSCLTTFVQSSPPSPHCECLTSQFMDGGNKCTDCTSKCITCVSLLSCNLCEAGYFLDSGYCSQCGALCTLCSSSIACSSCFAPYQVPISGQNACCDVGLWPPFCTPCTSNCSICASASTCGVSAAGFYVTASGLSEPCGAKCISCSSGSRCDICDSNYALDSPPNADCILCQSGQFTGLDGECHNCMSNCDSCSLASLCSVCHIGYWFDTSVCVACGTGCFSCSSAVCSLCNPGLAFTSLLSADCKACNSDQYINSSGLCENCGFQCLICDIGTCLTCQPSFSPLLHTLDCYKYLSTLQYAPISTKFSVSVSLSSLAVPFPYFTLSFYMYLPNSIASLSTVIGFSGGALVLTIDAGLKLEAVSGRIVTLPGFTEPYKWFFIAIIAAASSTSGFTDITLAVIDSSATSYNIVGQMSTFTLSPAETMLVGGTLDSAIQSITLKTAPSALSDVPGMALGYIFFYSVNQQFPFLLRVMST